MEGKGEWVSAQGNTYCGSFYNNLKHGWGVYRQKDGVVFEGYFQNGKKCETESPAKQLKKYREERFYTQVKKVGENK
jgi:hypothetical protein